MVYDVVLADGDISALQAAREAAFDPRTQIVLKKSSGAVASEAPSGLQGEAHIVDRGPNHVDVRVRTPTDGYLYLSEMWMPGWTAYVDGRREAVLQANYTFRAILVPAGTHDVHVSYEPVSWTIGASVTLSTVVVLMIWLSWSLARRRRLARSSPSRARDDAAA
jgi:hypothetical protein